MATRLYFSNNPASRQLGHGAAKLNNSISAWHSSTLELAAGTLGANSTTGTVTGATNGIEAVSGAARPLEWLSQPLAADVTISGAITWNLWAAESNMSANVAINGIIEVIDGATGAITLIDQTARVVELGVTTRTANNFAETPAAGIACKRGDRLRIRVFGDDAGTMAATYTFVFGYNSSVANLQESWFELTENLTFESEPAGSTIYPTDTASAVATASVDREAWTARGAGVVDDVTNTAAGWTAGIQATDTAGGTVVDWFTRPLAAFTLGGAVRCNIRALESADALAAVGVQIAVVNGDGTGAVVWATGSGPVNTLIGTLEVAVSFLIAGDDLAVSTGQRLRIRLLIDDSSINGPLATGSTVTTFYAGSLGSSGDTFLTFTQALAENVVSRVPRSTPYPQLLAH